MEMVLYCEMDPHRFNTHEVRFYSEGKGFSVIESDVKAKEYRL